MGEEIEVKVEVEGGEASGFDPASNLEPQTSSSLIADYTSGE